MKNIKKLNLTNRLAALLLAGTMATSLSACGGKADMTSLTIGDTLAITDVQNTTQIDELIASGKLSYEEGLTIVEAADKLERCMDISDCLSKMDFEKVEELRPLTEEEYNETINLSMEEVNALIELTKYKGNDIVQQEQKLVALKKLNYLYHYCSSWVHENGQAISFKIMMAAIKASVADELGVSVENYGSITIPPARRASSEGPSSYFIEVGDETYEVPTRSEELWNTIDYIYDVQIADLEGENEFKTYRKALNYAKTTIAAGANLKNNKLEAQYSASYIEKNYVK